MPVPPVPRHGLGRWGRWLALVCLAWIVSPGCSSWKRPADTDPAARSASVSDSPSRPAVGEVPGAPSAVFHRVGKGETLWRIARAYGVRWQDLAEANGITDPRAVPVGFELFIPGGKSTLEVPASSLPGQSLAPRDLQPPDSRFRWPIPGGEVVSPFGARRRSHLHAGIDIRGTSGQEVLAAASGRVTHSGPSGGGYGHLVVIDHGGGIETLYAHNSELLVRAGDFVEKGSPVARVGSTGNATADHCHFEVRRNKSPVDPMEYYADAENPLDDASPSSEASRARNRDDVGAVKEPRSAAAEK